MSTLFVKGFALDRDGQPTETYLETGRFLGSAGTRIIDQVFLYIIPQVPRHQLVGIERIKISAQAVRTEVTVWISISAMSVIYVGATPYPQKRPAKKFYLPIGIYRTA